MSAQHTHTHTHKKTHTHTRSPYECPHSDTCSPHGGFGRYSPTKFIVATGRGEPKDLSQTLQPFQHPVPVCSLFPPLPLRSSKQYIRLLF